MLNKLRYKAKLVSIMLILAIIPLITISLISIFTSKSALEERAFEQLTSIREIKKSNIESYFLERVGDITVFKDNPLVVNGIKEFNRVYKENGVQSMEYKTLEEQFGNAIKYYNDTYGYYDVFLINNEGDIVYTAAKEDDFATNVVTGKYSKTVIEDAYNNGKIGTSLVDFKHYEASNEPAAFVSGPIIENGNSLGVLVFQLSLEQINSIMQEKSGLGESGESYLIGKDLYMRSDSRFTDESTVLVQKIDTVSGNEAVSNKSASKIINDYRGISVLSSYAGLNINGLDWAIIVEIDEDEALSAVSRLQIIMVVAIILAVLIIVIVALIFATSVVKRLKLLTNIADKLALGDVDQKVNADSFDEIGDLMRSFDKMIENIKLQSENAQKIAEGILDIEIEEKSDKDILAISIKKVVKTLKELLDEANMLTKSAVDGQLDKRGNHDRFKGGYRNIVEGINATLDAVISPLNVAAEYVERISKGDIPSRINDEYKGDFNEIKNSINLMIDSLSDLINDMNKMSEHHDLGEIDEFVDFKKFEGVYRDMAQGVNEMVGGHIKITKKSMACVSAFANGNFNAELEKFPGKKSFINENIESLRNNLEKVNSEITKLISASQNGNLSERADAKLFKGDWSTIINGLNGLVDSIIEPIKEAAEVLEKMATGDLSVKVQGNYKGDHAKIKNSLNFTIETLSSYIKELSNVLDDLSNGNMCVYIDREYLGDFIEIKKSLNKIIDSFNDVLTELSNSAEQVALGSKQLSASSQTLSQGSTEQASSIEEISASIEEISSQTKENALNANSANEVSIEVKKNAESGNNQMKSMLESIQKISDSSVSISKIIKVIDEIAFQTNILALNAAVEAARAGQHGKGFAVVAEEVRNLAARSANAAKETTDLIEGSVEKVQLGTKIANETAQALDKIVDGINNTASIVVNIANASNEQASGIAQVNKAINEVSGVVQTNSATSEESAASSEELSSQADLLKQLVGNFKLKNTNNNNMIRNLDKEISIKQGKVDNLIKGEKNENNKIDNVKKEKVKISLDDYDDYGKY